MMKFFRKIRYDLMGKNKTGKYLKYAIGEIVLVVIGILIALQINNWNANRKAILIADEYYCQLLNDLRQEKEQLEALSKEAKQCIAIGKQLIKDLHAKEKSKNELIKDYLLAVRSIAYVPINATYKDLESSGNLGLLKNKDVKKNLIKYYSEVESINFKITENREFRVHKLSRGYDNVLELGWQEPSLSGTLNLDQELIDLLPINNWHLNPESDYFQRFQEVVFIGITIANREVELLKKIDDRTTPLYDKLELTCK